MWDMTSEYIWTIAVAKGISAIMMMSLCIITFQKYQKKKKKLAKHLSVMFLLYFIGTFITFINTITWYTNNDHFSSPTNVLPFINGVTITIATNWLYRFVRDVFYKEEDHQKVDKRIKIHFIFLMICMIVGIILSAIKGTMKKNPITYAMVAITFLTYLILMFHVVKTIVKMERHDVDKEYIQKMKMFIVASVFIIVSVLCITLDHLKHEGPSGYTWFNPLGYVLMGISMYFFYKSVN